MRYKFNLSAATVQQKGLMYLYDRCCFFKFLYLRKKSNKYFLVPKVIYPLLRLSCTITDLLKNMVCIAGQEFGLLFCKLVLESLGVFNLSSALKLVSRKENTQISSFCLLFSKQLNNFSVFDHINNFSLLLKTLIGVLNPVYTIQSFLYKVEQHPTGFCLTGSRLDSFSYLKWFDLVQSLFGLSSLKLCFNFRYNAWLLCLLNKMFFSKKNKMQTYLFAFISSVIGVHPRYFNYKKIISGLSFKIIYTNQIRVRLIS